MLDIRKYCIRTHRGNPLCSNVHMFVANRKISELEGAKQFATATVYPSLTHTNRNGYQTLLACKNELVTEAIRHELPQCTVELQPLTVAKHLADTMGIALIVVNTNYCDTATNETWWDLYYYEPQPALRTSISRSLLLLPDEKM